MNTSGRGGTSAQIWPRRRRRAYGTRAPPSGPGVTEKIATGLSCHDWFGGREAQSIAFLSAAVTEKLYSGLAMRTPSAPAISARSRFAGSGMPASNTSWLNSGRSSMRVMRRVMPWGMSSWHARSGAMVGEPFRGLPEIPRICMRASLAALGQVRDQRFEPLRVARQGAQLRERLFLRLPPALDHLRLCFLLVRELDADAVRIEEVDRPGVAAHVDRAQVLNAGGFDALLHLVEAFFRDAKGNVLHRADGVAVAPLLEALRDLEEREQRVAAGIEKVVADVLERRVAAVRGAGAETGCHLERVHQRHAEDADVEVERLLHVVGVQGEVVDAARKGLHRGHHTTSGAAGTLGIVPSRTVPVSICLSV